MNPNLKNATSDSVTKTRILIADDDIVIADTLSMILNQSGFEAKCVYSGERAVEAASDFKPQILLSDVIMHALNGVDAAMSIRALLPSVKIIFFNGQGATSDVLEKARAQGHEFEIMVKPVHPRQLVDKLRSMS